MSMGKRPARLSQLAHARASWHKMHPEAGDLPGIFVMEFGQAAGPAALQDGRALIAALTPAELATVLEAIPAMSLAHDTENWRALGRVIRLLRGEPATGGTDAASPRI